MVANRLSALLSRAMRLPELPVLLAPFVLLAPVFLAGRALFWGTPLLQFVPWWHYAWQVLRGGHLPLWNPLVGMGAPLLANYQSGLFYPPNWLYFALAELGGLPALAWGQAPLVAAHLAWAGLGMARLARRVGLGLLAQTISGLAFGLCGYLVARAGFLSITATVAWLPWVLLTAQLLATAGRPARSLAGTGLCVGMLLLAGHAQTAWYILLLAGLWVGFWAGEQARPGPGAATRPAFGRAVLRGWLRLALAGALGAGLAAVQILPTAEYLLQSSRAAAVDYEQAMTYSFWPWRLLTLLAPGLFGSPASGDYWGYANYWEDAIYVGLLPLLLAVGAALGLRKNEPGSLRRLIIVLLALLPVTLLLALGKNTPIFPWLYHNVPTFALFQAPARYLIWAEFSLALLAGLGLEAWQRPDGRALRRTRQATMAALGITLGAGLTWALMGRVSPTFIRATALAGVWFLAASLLRLLAPGARARAAAGRNPARPGWWAWAVGLLVAADLLVAGWGLNPGAALDLYRRSSSVAEHPALPAGQRLYLPPNDERVLKFERFLRFKTFHIDEDWHNQRAVLLPNTNLLEPVEHAIPSANNFDPLLVGRYVTWMEALAAAPPEFQPLLLTRMGVGLVERVSPDEPAGVSFTPLAGSNRWRWVACARSAADGDEALRLVLDPQTDPQREVILEGEPAAALSGCPAEPVPSVPAAQPARLDPQAEPWSPNRLSVRVQTPAAGWMVLSDVWYPGWRAQVNGEPVAIYRADYLFRAVPLAAGESTVEFVYQPLSFWAGLGLSLAALLALLAIGWKGLQEDHAAFRD